MPEVSDNERDALSLEDEIIEFKTRIVFDGNKDAHAHAYVDRGLTNDGLMLVVCSRCPHGTAYDPAKSVLQDGRIVDKR